MSTDLSDDRDQPESPGKLIHIWKNLDGFSTFSRCHESRRQDVYVPTGWHFESCNLLGVVLVSMNCEKLSAYEVLTDARMRSRPGFRLADMGSSAKVVSDDLAKHGEGQASAPRPEKSS